MALTEQTVIDHIGILEDGQIQVRSARRILDNGVRIAETYHRVVLEPGQDVTSYPPRLQSVCATLWTPAVIALYLAAHAARQNPS